MAITVDYGSQEEAMQTYFQQGAKRAMALGNRGPVRYADDGSLHHDILDAYWRCGFYVFEGVISAEELADLEAAFHDILDRLPVAPDSKFDALGRPAIGSDHTAPSIIWSKPLADPYGGTATSDGRHQVKMFEPPLPADAPEMLASSVVGSLQYSDALLRLYGHPDLLRVAAAVNGDDFVPFTEAVVTKRPQLGGIVAWHQDGMTHWDAADWDEGSHGFNFMAQLYGSTPATGVWFVPGSHKTGKANIVAMAAAAGSDRLPQAVPLVCAPGDVAISNRQVVHASFANTTPDWRVTFNMGFLRRRAVQDVNGYDFGTGQRVMINDARIHERSRLVGYAIDARRQWFPNETPYIYQPHAAANETYRWDAAARRSIHGYNNGDLIV